jgi:hypothetical protein
MRRRSLFVPLLAAASCAQPATPPAPLVGPTPPVPAVVSSVQILGLPSSLAPRATAPLRAEIRRSTGETRDCTSQALWKVDDPRVATVSAAGILGAIITGYFSVSATCESLTGTSESRVEAAVPYLAKLVAQDSEVVNHAGIDFTMEFLEGARTGERLSRGQLFAGIHGLVFPVRVRLTSPFHGTTDFVLAETTGQRRNSSSDLFDFEVPMSFMPDAFTETSVRRMSRDESEIRHPFRVASSGLVDIRTWWAVDYNDILFVELWCGDRMLRRISQRESSRGDGFAHQLDAGSACEVRLRQEKQDARTQYRLAIRHPH